MAIKAVLFDLWGTLVLDSHERGRPRSLWRTAGVARVLAEYGFALETDVLATALEATGRGLTALHDQGRDVSAAGRVGLFLELLEPALAGQLPPPALVALEEAICGLVLDYAPEPATGAASVLTEVRAAGLRTGLISNAGVTTAPYLRQMLAWHGIGDLFDFFAFSDELELAKPDVRIFSGALAALGLSPHEAVFIGDSPHHDIFGARAAGLYAIQIGHRGHIPPSGFAANEAAVPHAHIEDLAGLIAALASLDGPPGRGLRPAEAAL